MIGAPFQLAAERAWKHRFAQTLYEAFCESGLDRAAALADAYAHADAQYLVRGELSPENEARSSLLWIQSDEVQPRAANTDDATPANNPHNGAHHIEIAKTDTTD
ncbi:hypothetical protein [Rhizomicrobium electricum]|uniref:Uncharacterized protein n=1 Tax=Rhizomicrobium electricum TaxID=480070 RepID=A0ABN1E9J8_9PROT|nr:hypothetical protein [Rhizomicrobium electricum]NIJ47945.1 hypothetical protein [Rhizomicrobium electricum]